MIRLLFVVFVCLGGFAALALWNARGGDSEAVIEEILAGDVAAAVQAEVERLDEGLAELLAERASIDRNAIEERAIEEKAIEKNAIGGNTASGARDSGSGGNGAAAAAEPEPTPLEPYGDEGIRDEPRDDAAPIEVHDVTAPSEFARDLGGAIDDEVSDDSPPTEPWVTATSLDDAEQAADSADLIRRMLAVYPGARGRR